MLRGAEEALILLSHSKRYRTRATWTPASGRRWGDDLQRPEAGEFVVIWGRPLTSLYLV